MGDFMRMIELNSRVARRGLALLCGALLLGGCGLGKGHGSVATANQYQAEGKYRAAYIESKKVLQKDDKNGEAWLALGQASLMLGDSKDALSDLQHAKDNGVQEARWIVPMGRALLVTRQHEMLLKTLPADGAFLPPVKARVDALRGDAYVQAKQTDKAHDAYQSALAVNPRDAHALIGLARLALTAHDTPTAEQYLQKALAASPEFPQAWMLKGDLAFEAKDYAAAEAAYEKVLGFKLPDWLPEEQFYTLGRLADTQLQQGQYKQAQGNIDTLEKMSPGQPFPHYLHALALYKQGHLDDAVAQLQQVLRASPNSVPAQLLLGTVNYAQANYAQAQMYFSNVIGADAKNVPARKLLALTYFRQGRSDQALGALRPAMPGNATDAEMLALLQKAVAERVGMPNQDAAEATKAAAGKAAAARIGALDPRLVAAGKTYDKGDAAAAIKMLKAIPADDKAAPQRDAMLVMAYLRDKQPADAVKVAADRVAKYPKDANARMLYGTALVAAGQRGKARHQFAEAYTLDSKNVAALMNLASLDMADGKFKDAAGRYETILKQSPNNVAAMTELGQLAARQGDKAGAIKWFKQAIAAAPKAAAPYVGLVLLYSRSGDFEDAANVARQFAKADPESPVALNTLGAAELDAGHHDKALQPLQQAVKFAPNNALYLTNLARAQILDKDNKNAEANLEAAIKADPARVESSSLLAFLKYQNHDMPGALALAQTLQKQPATRAAGLALQGDLYMADKAWPKAAAAYQQALKDHYSQQLVIKTFTALNSAGAKHPETTLRDWLAKHPDDDASRLLLGQYYMNHTQNAAAIEQYGQVLKAHPTNIAALNNLAWIYTEQHSPKALEFAERAYKAAPNSPNIQDTYGWALVAANQPKTALPILAQVAKAQPKAGTIQYHYAVAQARTGDKAGARATLEALQKLGAKYPEQQDADKLLKELGGTVAGRQ